MFETLSTINFFILSFVNLDVFSNPFPNYIFKGETAREHLDYVKHLPDEESPQLMGLHDNAFI